MKKLIPVFLALAGALSVHAKIVTQVVEYKQGGTTLEGFLAYDGANSGSHPGVLVVHQWLGLTDYEKHRAEQLASLGYVAFCADIYGKGIRPQNTKEAGVEATKYKTDRTLLRARVNAGLDVLKKNKLVDTKRVAAIGYCFGGTTVIELARSGADIAGVVSFHGGLDSPTPADGKNIKCKVLACHGADDPSETPADLAAFEKELRDAKVDWRLNKYGGAVHSFTQPLAGNDNSKGAAYNERADKRSWADIKHFFAEFFKYPGGAPLPRRKKNWDEQQLVPTVKIHAHHRWQRSSADSESPERTGCPPDARSRQTSGVQLAWRTRCGCQGFGVVRRFRRIEPGMFKPWCGFRDVRGEIASPRGIHPQQRGRGGFRRNSGSPHAGCFSGDEPVGGKRTAVRFDSRRPALR